MRFWYLSCAFMFCLSSLSIALGSVPRSGQVTDDTAIYQNLSEIRVAREADLNFDGDIERLASVEANYRESLPKPSAARKGRIAKPMSRIGGQKYKYTGVRKSSARN
jgi:hypothetical protein